MPLSVGPFASLFQLDIGVDQKTSLGLSELRLTNRVSLGNRRFDKIRLMVSNLSGLASTPAKKDLIGPFASMHEPDPCLYCAMSFKEGEDDR